MTEFLNFRKMVTPLVIQIIFWIALIVVVIGALLAIFQGEVLSGLLMLIVGPLVVRVYCELLIVIFRIHDELVMIRTGAPVGGQGFPVTPLPTHTSPPATH